jgi:hypothetical protein
VENFNVSQASDFDFTSAAEDIREQFYLHKSLEDSHRLARGHVAIGLLIPEELSDDEIFDQLNQDFKDFGIDFFWMEERGASKVVHVMQLKDHESLSLSGQKDAISKMVAELIRLTNSSSPSALDERSYSRWRDLKDAQSTDNSKVVLYLVLTGGQEAKAEDFSFVPDLPLNTDILVIDRKVLLQEISRELALVETEVNLTWSPQHFSDFEVNGVRVLNGYISAAEYISRTRNWGQDLFQLNPRLFLETVRKGPNKEMLDTLNSHEREYFHLLNNGVTAVCNEMTKSVIGEKTEFALGNFQVVNGCQTTQTLWKWALLNEDKLDKVFVPLRVINSKNLAPKISVSTNSQNAINFLDLQSNSEVQRSIKAALEQRTSKPVFYENRRGSWEAASRSKNEYLVKDWGATKGNLFRRLTSRDLCQTLLAVAGLPYRSKENLGELIETPLLKHLLTTAWSSPHQLALIADLFIYISRRELWVGELEQSQFVNTGKFYVISLIYKHWLISENELDSVNYNGDEQCFRLLSPESSKRIRDDFTSYLGKLPISALRTIETDFSMQSQNPGFGPRMLLRNPSHYPRISILFEQLVKF